MAPFLARYSYRIVLLAGIVLVVLVLLERSARQPQLEPPRVTDPTSTTTMATATTATSSDAALIAEHYAPLVPMTIGSTTVQASVAATRAERIQGLSDTPRLPEDIVKLFVFDSDGEHGIWMRKMQYPIDIIWVDRAGEVVHIVAEAAPESYPEVFESPTPARYVIETAAGVAAQQNITVGTTVDLPSFD